MAILGSLRSFVLFCFFVFKLVSKCSVSENVESACEVPIWDQRPWSMAMSVGPSCAFSSEQVSLMPGSCCSRVGLRGTEEDLK